MEQELSTFEQYLLDQDLSPATARRARLRLRRFLLWLKKEHLLAEEASYADLAVYLEYRRQEGLGQATLRHERVTLQHYLALLVEDGQRPDNPAVGLALRPARQRLPHDLLSEEELARLYEAAPTATPSNLRNRVLIGLLVYQGLTAGELERLRVAEVDLGRGRITIAESARGAGRTLELKSVQILDLQRYLTQARPRLLKMTGREETSRLFVSSRAARGRGTAGLKNTLAEMMRHLRARHDYVTTTRQLRASRIVLWLRRENLRRVQTWAGHRSVGSTERYREADTEALLEALQQVHRLDLP